MTDRSQSRNDSSSTDYSRPNALPYQKEETLQELYCERKLSQDQIANKFGVTQQAISYWIQQHELQRDIESGSIYRTVDDDGKAQYIQYTDDGLEHLCYEHQLVALEDHSAEDVFDSDTHVHHLMAAPYAVDLPENLIVMDVGEHLRRHADGTAVDHPETILQHTFDEFEPKIGSVYQSNSEENK